MAAYERSASSALAESEGAGRPLVFLSMYLPPIDALRAMLRSSRVVVEVHDSYQRQTYRNRAIIATPQGALPLVVPVVCLRGHRTKMWEVQVDYRTRWREVHLGALQAAYARTAFAYHYLPTISDILYEKHDSLVGLNARLLRFLLDAYGAKGLLVEPTERWEPRYVLPVVDLREAYHPKRARPCGERYFQNFQDRCGFLPNLTAVDHLLHEGPTP